MLPTIVAIHKRIRMLEHCPLMWASAAVCGPLAPNVGRLDANVGLAPHVLAANLVPLWPCLWAHALLFVGHYN